MAKSEKNKKEGGLIEGFEGPVGFIVRELVQHELPKPMARLKQNFPSLYYTGAWAFTDPSPEAGKLKEKLLGGLVMGGWLGEQIVDLIGTQSFVAKVAEMFFGDLPSAIKNYFERIKPGLPADFTPPTPDKFDEVVDSFKKELKEYFGGWSKDLRPTIERIIKALSLDRLLGAIGLGKTDLILGSYLDLQGTDRRKLSRLWRKWTPEQRHNFTRDDKYFPTSDALSRYVRMTPLERKVFEEMAEANKHRLLSPDHEKAFRVWRRNVARYGRETLQMANQGLEDAVLWLAEKNADRRIQISDERFSPLNLEKFPWRRAELPADHPLRYPVPKKLSWKARIRSTWLGWVAMALFVGLVIFSLAAVAVSRMLNEVPRVVINSPNNSVEVTTPSVRLIGQATDDHRVSQMSYRLNNQMPRKILVASGRSIDWTTEVKDLQSGWNTILIEVRDGQGRHNTTDIRVRYVGPADTMEVY